mmetsp:Transcript_6960/g.26031  ORF Transcript_6960/g.26031 Transcript_6960/m.26031 type:complete len:144 (+) Transcript_6960:478-909(+)
MAGCAACCPSANRVRAWEGCMRDPWACSPHCRHHHPHNMTHNTPHAEIVQNIRLARKMFRGARLVTVPRPRKDPKAAAWKRQYFVFRNMKRVKQTNGKVRGEVMLTWEADPEQKVLPAAEAFHEMWVRVHRESKVRKPFKIPG